MANGEDNTSQGIKTAVSIIITLLFVGIVIAFFAIIRPMMADSQQQTANMANTLQDSMFTDYEGSTIKGSQVQSLVSQYKSEPVCVKVKTKTNTTTYNYTDTTLSTKSTVLVTSVTDKSKSNYINPNGDFECTIQRDENGTIKGITFTQQ